MSQLVRLFQPGRIGKMEVRNRVVMPAMGTFSAAEDGTITDRTVDYYEERARGGVGLIITQASRIMPEAGGAHLVGLFDDKFIPGMSRIAQAGQRHGAKVVCQLGHSGVFLARMNVQMGQKLSEVDPIGPSALYCVPYNVTSREMTKGDIQRAIDLFARGAGRAKKAGFDGVEVHAAHGYLLSSFLSPYRNRRTDEYGGSTENRARFVCEVVARVRQTVGPDFPVLLRINGSDFLPGGITLEETVKQAPMFVEAGADALNVSAASQESTWWRDLTYLFPDGAIVHLAAAIKKAVKVPVIAVGKIGDPVLAEQILTEGKADFVAMGRALLVDPYLPQKAKEGRFDDIRRCIYCNNCRLNLMNLERIKKRGAGLACTVNPELLREKEFAITPVGRPKKVMVGGGGLAGMEAARVLALRGHNVTLYEKGDRLGGQWNIASAQAGKQGFASLTGYLNRELARTKARVVLNTEVTRELAQREKPDAVVVTTGAVPFKLPVRGVDGANVVQATDVLAGKAQVSKTVTVVGGRLRGMELAELLARKGHQVSLVTKNRLGEDGAPLERNLYAVLRDRLLEQKVAIYAQAPVLEITPDGVYIAYDGELRFVPGDTVVLAVGAKAENALLEELKGVVPELYAAGDCVKPRDAREATNEAAEVARLI